MIGKGQKYIQPRSQGSLLPAHLEREISLSLAPGGRVGENPGNEVEVHPIFKSDERNIPSNYGPISILPAILKIIKRAMHTQLLEYFQACNLLTESRSGFRPNHSTCTALISAVYLWLTNLDAGKVNGSVFITSAERKLKDLRCSGMSQSCLFWDKIGFWVS